MNEAAASHDWPDAFDKRQFTQFCSDHAISSGIAGP
jgi:hypothetical protein